MQTILLQGLMMHTYYFQCTKGKRGLLTSVLAINQGKAIEKVYKRYPLFVVTIITREQFYDIIEKCLANPKTMARSYLHFARARTLRGGMQRARCTNGDQESQGSHDQARQGRLPL